MIADNSRVAAYVAALQQAIKPGGIVADIGTGPGFFALLACKLGARRVYAIEPDNVIQVAREVAAANGFADRIEFIQDFSTRVTLPEKADVIVSDLRGILPWFQRHLPSIQDARSRLLAPNGVLIPKRDTLWAAAVEVEETYGKLVGPWHDGKYNIGLTPVLKFVTNVLSKTHIKTNELLSDPVLCYTLDYAEFEQSNMQATISLPIRRSGVIHGFTVWFDSEVFDGISLSNKPGNEGSIYGSAFFPLPQPVACKSGTNINIKLRADLIGEDYVWQWDTKIANAAQRTPGDITFKQSTLIGTPLSGNHLRKRAATYIPSLTSDGQIDHFILSRIDGKSSLEEIAQQLSKQFPDRFEKVDDALDLVADISSKYSE
jgi:Ribosomal protein L11 methyltransferase (PrmA)/Arginine methyltransferase oligomerization subdomain